MRNILIVLGALLFAGISISSMASEQAQKHANPIIFTPLPMKNPFSEAQDYLPLLQHLEQALDRPVEFRLHQQYEQILDDLEQNNIDLTILGPLPYLVLKRRTPKFTPLALLNSQQDKAHYRCVISKFRGDKVDLKQAVPVLKVALTQSLSTCGYFKTQSLLSQTFGLQLDQLKFDYTGSHKNAIEAVLKGEFDLAGSSEEYAYNYQSLGMEVIAKSNWLPGLIVVANNQTLDRKTQQAIQKVLLSIPSHQALHWPEKIRYGFQPIKPKELEALRLPINIPAHGNFGSSINEATQ